MTFDEPNIAPSALQAITAPTLVLAGDHDLIRDEHTLDIFHHVPNSQLAIFPNATHMAPYHESALFNATVERFLRAPYVKGPDRGRPRVLRIAGGVVAEEVSGDSV